MPLSQRFANLFSLYAKIYTLFFYAIFLSYIYSAKFAEARLNIHACAPAYQVSQRKNQIIFFVNTILRKVFGNTKIKIHESITLDTKQDDFHG